MLKCSFWTKYLEFIEKSIIFAPRMQKYTFMKKIFAILCSVFTLTSAYAFKRDTFPDIKPGEHSTVEFHTEYGFNDVWSHHGNFDLSASVPIHKHFDMKAGIQLSTANVYTLNVELNTFCKYIVNSYYFDFG